MARLAYLGAGLFLIVQAVYIAERLYRGGDLLMLAGAFPALVAAFALGWLLVLRNLNSKSKVQGPTSNVQNPGVEP